MDFGEYREMGGVLQVTYQKAFSRIFKKNSMLLCFISSGRLAHVLCIIFLSKKCPLPHEIHCYQSLLQIIPVFILFIGLWGFI